MEKFRECYSELYNSSDTSASMETIKLDLISHIRDNIQMSVHEAMKITPDVIIEAVNRMKSGKSDVSGYFTSDVFINGPMVLYEHIAAVFRSYLIHGTLSNEIIACAFLPIWKGGVKPQDSFHSYRAIAGASQLFKLLEYVILVLWGHHLSSDSLQFAYKQNASTSQATWFVSEIANYYYQRGGMLHCAALDMTKAFDTILYSELFKKISARGVPAIVVRVLIFAYQEQHGWVRVAGANSDSFTIKNGTRQGSVLSPALFSCYMDELLQRLRRLNLGCSVAGVWMGASTYADDVFLLSPNQPTLQRMMNVCQEFGKEHNLAFSTDPVPAKSKTKCIIFSGNKNLKELPPPIMLDGKALPYVASLDYLGHTLHQSMSMEMDSVRATNSFKRRAHDIRDQLHFCHPKLIMRFINVFCGDLYGSQIWSLDSDYASSFYKQWNVMARTVFGTKYNTHVSVVEGFLCSDIISFKNQVLSRYPKFVRKLLESTSKEVRFLSRIVIADQRSNTCRNISYISNLTKINDVIMVAGWRVREALKQRCNLEQWRKNLLTTFMQIRYDKTYEEFNMTKHQLDQFIDSLMIS